MLNHTVIRKILEKKKDWAKLETWKLFSLIIEVLFRHIVELWSRKEIYQNGFLSKLMSSSAEKVLSTDFKLLMLLIKWIARLIMGLDVIKWLIFYKKFES